MGITVKTWTALAAIATIVGVVVGITVPLAKGGYQRQAASETNVPAPTPPPANNNGSTSAAQSPNGLTSPESNTLLEARLAPSATTPPLYSPSTAPSIAVAPSSPLYFPSTAPSIAVAPSPQGLYIAQSNGPAESPRAPGTIVAAQSTVSSTSFLEIYDREKVYCVQPNTEVCAYVYSTECTGQRSWKTQSDCCDEQSTLKDRCLCGNNRFDYGCSGSTWAHSKCYGKYGANATSCVSPVALYETVCVPRDLPTLLCATVDSVADCINTDVYKTDTSLSLCCYKYSSNYNNYTIAKGMAINSACMKSSNKYSYDV